MHLIDERILLKHSPALDNLYYYDNYSNHKQDVNKTTGMKGKEAYCPSNDQDNGENVK
jgi:hypothetical protein